MGAHGESLMRDRRSVNGGLFGVSRAAYSMVPKAAPRFMRSKAYSIDSNALLTTHHMIYKQSIIDFKD